MRNMNESSTRKTIIEYIDQLAQGNDTGDVSIDNFSRLDRQYALARCYEYEFNTMLASKSDLLARHNHFYSIRTQLENDLLEYINNRSYLACQTPWDINLPAENYLTWLKQLIRTHSSYTHPYYTKFLANKAQFADVRYYLAQESTLDPRFDDLLAFIQIGIPNRMKMELAKNYWDEMGNGNLAEVHSSLFSKTMQYFDVNADYIDQNILPEAIISGNISSMLTIYRENFARAIGYFGATEYCVPYRFKYFIHGCQRLGVDNSAIEYHILHETIDAKHAVGWFTEVILPMVTNNPEIAHEVTQGALLRLNSSYDYLNALQSTDGYTKFNEKAGVDAVAQQI